MSSAPSLYYVVLNWGPNQALSPAGNTQVELSLMLRQKMKSDQLVVVSWKKEI